MRPHRGLRRFRLAPRYPHKRSEGLTVRRTNGGTKALILPAPVASTTSTTSTEGHTP